MAAISNHINIVRSKDAERERIAADVAAFLRKRGNKVQRYAMGERGEGPLLKSLRQLSTEQGARDAKTRKARAAAK